MSETTAVTQTKFVKITREEFDKVLRVGTNEFLNRVPSMTVEQLQRGEQWINQVRAQKGPNTYLVFPVSQPKQLAAGKLYLKAISLFRTAVREELATRAVSELFGEVAAAA